MIPPPVIVKGFNKIGKIVDDNPADPYFTVEFERLKIQVDRKTNCIVLPSSCVSIQN